jgi:hypothetical protein
MTNMSPSADGAGAAGSFGMPGASAPPSDLMSDMDDAQLGGYAELTSLFSTNFM